MSVFKRKTSKGITAEYHYAFMMKGERYSGVCKGCTTERTALKFEEDCKKDVLDGLKPKNRKEFNEKIRDKRFGCATVLLKDAFELSLNKPHSRRSSDTVKNQKRVAFADFVAFMHGKYPDVEKLDGVEKKHAEEYVSLLAEHGRYLKEVTYIRKGKTIISGQPTDAPSPRTINFFITTMQEVFRLLAEDAGIYSNPFSMPKVSSNAENREVFSMEELEMIKQNLDDFSRPLFVIALTTALREGDICTLQWKDVDFQRHLIYRTMRKTGNMVGIPLFKNVEAYLMQQQNDSPYVFPEHAKMYLENPSGVSYRIKKFLEGIGIETTRVPAGRSRAVSVKDLHSCRHTFCYLAGINKIPIPIVQSIVGHMSPEMTMHYMAHDSLEGKRKAVAMMQDVYSMTGLTLDNSAEALPVSEEDERKAIIRELESMTTDKLRRLLELAKNN